MSFMSSFSRYAVHPLWDLREGSARLKFLRELERSQWSSRAELEERQRERLGAIVRHAYSNSPYYRRLLDEHRIDVDHLDYETFSRIPFLTKRDIRAHTDELLCRGYDKATLSFHKTGGSTGTSLTTYFDESWEQRRQADALRSNQWAGWFHGMKVMAIWGNPPAATSWKQRLRSSLRDRIIYFDTMSITEETLSRFVATFRRERPEVVFGHSHSIFIVARYLLQNEVRDLRPLGIVSTSMMLLPAERVVIEKAFGCAVTNRYGCEEVALIACECEQHSGLHLNIEHLFIELLRPDGRPAAPEEEGAVVVTDLFNMAMPLLRYRVEDIAVPSARACKCGRGMPIIERVVGRVADYLQRPDGTLIAGVSLVERTLTALPGIEQMQIVQPELERIVLNLVKAPDFSDDTEAALRDELGRVFGESVAVEMRYVTTIPRERSGKYRFSICQIGAQADGAS